MSDISEALKIGCKSVMDETRRMFAGIPEVIGRGIAAFREADRQAEQVRQAQYEAQKRLEQERADRELLHYFNALVVTAIAGLPDFLNLENRISAVSLQSKYDKRGFLAFRLFKVKKGEKFSPGSFETARDTINSAFESVRFEQEKDIEERKQRLAVELSELSYEFRTNPGQKNYELLVSKLQNEYRDYVNHNMFYLAGYQVTGYLDSEEAVAFRVICDPTVRIQLWQ